MKITRALAIAGIFSVANVALAQELDLDAGTMQLGGAASFDIDLTMPGGGSDSTMGIYLGIVPTLGYFVVDNLEINVDASLGRGFGDLYDGSGTQLGIGVGNASLSIPIGYFGVQAFF